MRPLRKSWNGLPGVGALFATLEGWNQELERLPSAPAVLEPPGFPRNGATGSSGSGCPRARAPRVQAVAACSRATVLGTGARVLCASAGPPCGRTATRCRCASAPGVNAWTLCPCVLVLCVGARRSTRREWPSDSRSCARRTGAVHPSRLRQGVLAFSRSPLRLRSRPSSFDSARLWIGMHPRSMSATPSSQRTMTAHMRLVNLRSDPASKRLRAIPSHLRMQRMRSRAHPSSRRSATPRYCASRTTPTQLASRTPLHDSACVHSYECNLHARGTL